MSVEKSIVPVNEIAVKRERDRTRYWMNKFVGSLDPEYAENGLLQTQTPTIRKVIGAIVSNTSSPGEIINPIITDEGIRIPDFGGLLWPSLDYLMQGAEQLTGSRYRYTPHEYIDSVRGFSNQQLARYLDTDRIRRGDLHGELEVSSDRREILKGQIDSIVDDPNFVEAHTKHWGRPEYVVFPYRYERYEWHDRMEDHIVEQRAFLTKPDITEQERREVRGKMRSFDTCNFQSQYILDHLPGVAPDIGFLYGEGESWPFLGGQGHEVLFAVSNNETKASVLEAEKQAPGFPLLNNYDKHADILPPMSAITVIDATVLQLFEMIPFIDEVPPAERVAFAQAIAPGSFSTSGVFVDNYAKYVQFLGLMSSYTPYFFINSNSFSRGLRER